MMKEGNRDIFKCNNRGTGSDEPFYFLPIYVGALTETRPNLTFTDGLCFEKTEF